MIEQEYFYPEIYFSKEAAYNYDHSPRMRQMQRELTERALELLGLTSGHILDVGCGTGFSMQVISEQGFTCEGIDISEYMVAIAVAKGYRAQKGDMHEIPYAKNLFDGLISISTLQWVTGKSYDDIVTNYERVAREFYRVLKRKGRAVVQFYPRTQEILDIAAQSFKKAGFKVTIAVDYPDVQRRTKKYLVMEK